MTDNNLSRRERHGHRTKRRPKKRRLGCLIILGILLFLLLIVIGVGAFFYYRVNTTLTEIQQSRPEEQINLRDESVSNLVQEKESFSILLLGVDTGSEGRIDQGRSDIMVVATVNPYTENMTLTSIPRDTLTEIIGKGTEDKINHAYAFGGVSMAANTVQNLLDIPIDYTISANMQGFSDIIDTLGGITITSVDTFTQGDYNFVEGQSYTMDGDMALAYTRNRYDTGGDYSRQERARQLVGAIVEQATQLDSIANIPGILSSLNGNVQTDLSLNDIRKIAMDYRHAIQNIEMIQLDGSGEMIDGGLL
ncbi:LCP family protein [Aerococcaceae bacterium WGS1372]